MSEVRIYGASDDLLEFDGGIEDELSKPSGNFEVLLKAPDGAALVVRAKYTLRGVWALAVCQTDEDDPLPDWPILLRPGLPDECSYSPTLVIQAPEGLTLSHEGKPS